VSKVSVTADFRVETVSSHVKRSIASFLNNQKLRVLILVADDFYIFRFWNGIGRTSGSICAKTYGFGLECFSYDLRLKNLL
jgi:hypothetical protein